MKIHRYNIELLDCQVDLVLRALEFYSYTYKFIYPRFGKSNNNEENLKISLVNDTFEQILSQYNGSSSKNYFKKIA